MASFSGVTSQQPGSRLTTLSHLFCGTDSALSLLEKIFILVTDLPFLHIMLLPKKKWTLLGYHIHYRGIPHSTDSGQGTHFTAREFDSGPTSMESPGLTMWIRMPDRKMKQPLEGIYSASSVAAAWRAGARFSQRWYVWNQCQIYGMVLPHSQEPQVQAPRGGKGNSPPAITSSDPLGNFFCFLLL